MQRMALKLTVIVLALSSVSCGVARGLGQTGGRLLQAVGRTVGM
jgi:hypothetical protein